MDFFQAQETLTAIEWILRAVVAFLFLLLVGKVLGQRTISQLRLLDFIIALVIGNIIAHPLSDEHLGLEGSMITTIVLVVLYLCALFGILKFPFFRKLINSHPVTVVKNGEILYKGLKKAKISIDVLLEELRKEKIGDVTKVALAIWEADGKLSVFLQPEYEPVTSSLMQIKVDPFDLPKTLIKEGKIDYDELKQINKDESWIASNLKSSYQAEVKDVLLATLDNKGSLKVFLYR
jgi:uncharacterized membrane protein YcaP (DUF421 family)